MDFGLHLKQSTKLLLTQTMKLSLNVLEMSTNDIINFLETEQKNNPAIEIVYPPKIYKSTDEEKDYDPIDFYTQEADLVDILEEQINYLSLEPKIKEISIFIINNLDNRGYLAIPKSEIIKVLKISDEVLKKSLEVVNYLEPIGIASENLQECLSIQLKEKKIEDKNLYTLIEYYLEELAMQKFDELALNLNCTSTEIKNYLKIIQTLNPIPARGYKVKNSSIYIIPDAVISIVDKKLQYKINDENIPKVYINTTASATQKEIDRVHYIIKSIEKRYITLEKIVQYLLIAQSEFFFKGKRYLKTLSLKDISNQLKLHDSTISRAIKDKYLDTPQGIISFKSLLIYDENIFKIKELIEKAINEENKSSPLSDNELSLFLASKGYTVARRTVAKYREEIGLKSSRQRKKNISK